MAPEEVEAFIAKINQFKEKGASDHDGEARCFYTLWENEGARIWERVPLADLIDSIEEGTGRQDWKKLRPFDLLPELNPDTGGCAKKQLMAGEKLRIASEAICGSEPYFHRAGDFQTIFFQFSGSALLETSFGVFELNPGEAVLIPAMIAHRTTGSSNCRRMCFYVKDVLEVKLDPDKALTNIRYEVRRPGEPQSAASQLKPTVPVDGKILERLVHWDGRPEDAYIFRRTYSAIVGKAESGPRVVKIRPFDYFTTPPTGPKAAPVRTALLWEGPTFRQRVYSNPGVQPAPHRGYDEDEYWFQFSGRVEQIGEHGIYTVESGEVSMAEAGISHTSINVPGSLRLTTYTNKPIRRIADPSEHLRVSQWEVHENILQGWREA
jgi:mannose-6-phosphate isomerase-like protein (cupin superfamily)